MTRRRAYLDWNASAPLRPEAREAMLAAMDEAGNPSAVHAEGRAARAIVERARADVAALAGCEPGQVVFTSGASEANTMAFARLWRGSGFFAATEHESVVAAAHWGALHDEALPVDRAGRLRRDHPLFHGVGPVSDDPAIPEGVAVLSVAAANGETGVIDPSEDVFRIAKARGARPHCDATQAVGRIAFSFRESGAATGALSAHKIGGPKGVGAFIHDDREHPHPLVRGGGQEEGWRAGTENVIGIAGFAAAARAAKAELEAGAWERVAELRNILESRLEDEAPDLIIFGKEAPRLPNTSCFAVPGWAGETQVMAMDLAGFAVSAGSACSSGKVARASRVLLAMGFDETTASSAIRVSLGPTNTEAEVLAFAEAWTTALRRRSVRAA